MTTLVDELDDMASGRIHAEPDADTLSMRQTPADPYAPAHYRPLTPAAPVLAGFAILLSAAVLLAVGTPLTLPLAVAALLAALAIPAVIMADRMRAVRAACTAWHVTPMLVSLYPTPVTMLVHKPGEANPLPVILYHTHGRAWLADDRHRVMSR